MDEDTDGDGSGPVAGGDEDYPSDWTSWLRHRLERVADLEAAPGEASAPDHEPPRGHPLATEGEPQEQEGDRPEDPPALGEATEEPAPVPPAAPALP
ncbi:MAG: hypothetical protein KY431_07955, partial [Actinobacteria bacterium]|nr:hypothetical protein [Actinomycetota bacterium]